MNVFTPEKNMVIQVHVLVGYEEIDGGIVLVNRPMWKRMSFELLEELKNEGANKILCRMRRYEELENEIQPVDSLKLPIYNEYFMIDIENAEVVFRGLSG